MTYKKVFSAPDAAPAVLYAKRDADSQHAFPLLQSAFNPGFAIPQYDSITLGYTSNVLTSVVYKLSSATVATLTLTYTDGNLTGVEKT